MCRAGGRRPPLITQCVGGRPKVARVCSLLIFAPVFRKSLYLPSNSAIASRSNSIEDIRIQISFEPPLAACGCQVSKPSHKRLPYIQCAGHQRAADGRSGTLAWRVAKGRLHCIVLAGMCLAGARRPPLITQRLGGRPEAARVCSLLICSPAFLKSLYLPSNSAFASRSNSTEDIRIQIPFGPPLAGLNF